MMINKTHRGRGRPRKNPLLGINIIISKKPRSSKFDAPKIDPHPLPPPPPPPPQPQLQWQWQWHSKRSRYLAVAVDRRAAPSTSSSLSGSGLTPFDDQDGDDDVLASQCLADFEIPGPIPDLIDLMSDMSIFQDFFRDVEHLNLG